PTPTTPRFPYTTLFRSDDFLVEGGRAEIHYTARDEEAIDHIWRNHDITKPQRGEEDFAESPDVDHAGVGIEALQRGDGLAFVARSEEHTSELQSRENLV